MVLINFLPQCLTCLLEWDVWSGKTYIVVGSIKFCQCRGDERDIRAGLCGSSPAGGGYGYEVMIRNKSSISV